VNSCLAPPLVGPRTASLGDGTSRLRLTILLQRRLLFSGLRRPPIFDFGASNTFRKRS